MGDCWGNHHNELRRHQPHAQAWGYGIPTLARGAGKLNGREMSMSVFASRRERLWQTAVPDGLDVVLVTSPINVTYLTGFTGESSYLLLTKTRTLLVSDGRFKGQLAEECAGLDAYIRSPAQPLPDATIA